MAMAAPATPQNATKGKGNYSTTNPNRLPARGQMQESKEPDASEQEEERQETLEADEEQGNDEPDGNEEDQTKTPKRKKARSRNSQPTNIEAADSETNATSDADADMEEVTASSPKDAIVASRRTSNRLAQKATTNARALAAKSTPTAKPRASTTKKNASAVPPTATTMAAVGRSSQSGGTSSPGGTPAPLGDPVNLARLAEVASKSSKVAPSAGAGGGSASKKAPTATSAGTASAATSATSRPASGNVGSSSTGPTTTTAGIVGPTAKDLLTTIEASGSADVIEILTSDPNDKLLGYKQLEDWIDGGLDMYRHEFRPLLFPIFCHFYLELVQQGFKEAAIKFFTSHSPGLLSLGIPLYNTTLHTLSALLLPTHIATSPLAQRFRSEKFVIQMSRAGFALFVGWLTEGTGAEGMGIGEGIIEGGREGSGRRARMSVLTVVNGRLKFHVASSTTLTPAVWEENTGLVASLIPTTSSATAASMAANVLNKRMTTNPAASLMQKYNPSAFNAAQGELKLGPAPLSDSLRDEMEKALKDEPIDDGDRMAVDGAIGRPTTTEGGDGDSKTSLPDGDVKMASPGPSRVVGQSNTSAGSRSAEANGVIAPTYSDLLPQPPAFRSVDVKREVERVRDARKRIKLDPGLYAIEDADGVKTERNGIRGSAILNGYVTSGSGQVPNAALPSICAYTFHDALDGLNCSTFSEDSSLMAAGFTESYIRIWSLKKDRLKGFRSDFNVNNVHDPTSLKKIREKSGSSTRKLVGHSAPVYALSFDRVGGTAVPPKYLLSASADHTTRLWSLETMTNVVAYRGHNNPVWDVHWSSTGVYFATASRDRTARLWSAERTNALRVFAGHLSDVDCVRFHPNSLYLATGSSDSTCRLWDVQRGNCMRVFIGHQGPITSIAMSPDGRYLASASTDLSISLWDLASGRRIKSMMGHTAPINSLAFTACTTMLISGSSDWTVRCWDVKGAGGTKPKALKLNGAEEGALPNDTLDEKEDVKEQTVDLLVTFPTKRTPVTNVQVTPRNLVLVSGPHQPPATP